MFGIEKSKFPSPLIYLCVGLMKLHEDEQFYTWYCSSFQCIGFKSLNEYQYCKTVSCLNFKCSCVQIIIGFIAICSNDHKTYRT